MNWKEHFDKEIREGDIVYYIYGNKKRYGKVFRIDDDKRKKCWCKRWSYNIGNVDDGSRETYVLLSECRKVKK